MVSSSSIGIAPNNIGQADIGQTDEGLNRNRIASWLGRALESVSELSTIIPRNIVAAVDAIGLGLYNIRDLFNPDDIPNPESTAQQSQEPVEQQEILEASEPQPPTGAECSVCLTDFQNVPKAALLPECVTPTWIHLECLSQYTQNRIVDPITKDEINGIGIACPACCASKSHTMHVNKLAPLISSPEGIRTLQDFHLQSQLRIFTQDPFSPLLDPVVTKNATCPDCQHQYFVNLRVPEQAVISCSGLLINRRNIDTVACTRVFCANCEETPHFDISCHEASVRRPIQQLSDLNAKLETYRMARDDDSRFRPCPKCDNFIERSEGCNHIQRTGLHAAENEPEDSGQCDHNICFECLKEWGVAQRTVKRGILGVRIHDFYQCNDSKNRQRIYARKIASITQDIITLGGSPDQLSTTCFHRLTKCCWSSGARLSAGS